VNSYGDLAGLHDENNNISGMESGRGRAVSKNVRQLSGMSAYPPHIGTGGGLEDPAAASSAKDIAVTLVEGVFVLAEFSYWQVRVDVFCCFLLSSGIMHVR